MFVEYIYYYLLSDGTEFGICDNCSSKLLIVPNFTGRLVTLVLSRHSKMLCQPLSDTLVV